MDVVKELATTRVCIKCGKEKSFLDFYTSRVNEFRDYVNKTCKRCRIKNSREIKIRKNFGISLDEYNKIFKRLLLEQGGVCAICGCLPNETAKYFVLDHDHDTGRFRGVLCDPCNLILGRVGDNEMAIRKLLKYVLGEISV